MKWYNASILMLLMSTCMPIWAWSWHTLWQTPDQRAARLLAQGQAAKAETLFNHQAWKGVAAYRAGHFSAAADYLQQTKDENSLYNQGNALAKSGRYQQAIAAYDKALAITPKDKDTLYNRTLVKKLLKQQNQQSQDKQQETKKKKSQAKQQPSKHQDPSRAKSKHHKPSKQPSPSQQPQPTKQQKPQQLTQQKNSNAKPTSQHNKARNKPKKKPSPTPTLLKQLDDDPGGLLRQKFLRDYQRQLQGQ